MTGESISVQVHENIVFQDLDKKPYSLLNFLLFTGYLTYNSPYEKDLLSYAHFSIPNNEIMSLYKTIILDWFSEQISITYYQQMLSHLTAGNVEDFIDFFKLIVAQSLSTLDVAENEPEKFSPPRLLSGHDLIAMGFKPSPRMGEIITAIEDAQLEGEVNTKEEAEKFVLNTFERD